MKKPFLFSLLLLTCCLAYAQKSQVLNPSGFTHNYVVGRLKHIEDLKDTSRLQYIAGLRMSFTSNPEELSLLDFIKVKAKELGADCYYLVSHTETETTYEAAVKLFFGGEKFLKDNEKKQPANRLFIFNQTHRPGDTAVFYLNGKKQAFDAQSLYTRELAINEACTIGVNEAPVTRTEVLFKKTKKARFFILPENKKSLVLGQARPLGTLVIVNGLPLNVHLNSFYEMSYDLGRLWLEVYK